MSKPCQIHHRKNHGLTKLTLKQQQQNLRKEQNSDSDSEVNITDEALIAANAVMDSFLKEVVQRAAAAAVEDGETLVTEVHLERVLPQLLLDFTS